MLTTSCYAGIGSRSTPKEICALMTEVAGRLATEGWVLRSGHAEGADLAFETGAGKQAEVYLPWGNYNSLHPIRATREVLYRPSLEATRVARRFHPYGHDLRPGPLALHARNSHIVLGYELDSPVKFAICWTRDGSLIGAEENGRSTGGTGQALRIAERYAIPVFNLGREEHYHLVTDWLDGDAGWLSS